MDAVSTTAVVVSGLVVLLGGGLPLGIALILGRRDRHRSSSATDT